MTEAQILSGIRGSIESDAEKERSSAIKDIDHSVCPSDLKKDRYRKDTIHRYRLVITVMAIIILWLLCVMALLFLSLFRSRLSDAVLIALLGTTTFNVLGLAVIVLKGFFQYMEQDIKFDE